MAYHGTALKRIQSAFTIALTAFLFIFLQVFNVAAELQKAPLNPAFLKWQASEAMPAARKVTMGKETRFHGLRPGPLDFSHLKRKTTTPLRNIQKASTFPAAYDLRTKSKLSPVKEQVSGTCWAFASMAAMESYLLPDETRDLFELQMAYIAYVGDDSFTPDPNYIILDQGGDMWKATAILSRWSSPVNESDVQYGENDVIPNDKPVQKHLQKALYLPNMTSVSHDQFNADNIKNGLMNYGAVAIGMHWPEEGEEASYNSETNAFYYNGENSSNHEVNIVGWDDTFAKEKFPTMPEGNGAWIVRNSWGGTWGEQGYFYMSYYDTAIDDGVALVVEDVDNYDNIYQYDPLGWITSIGDTDSDAAMYANVFTATGDETLKAVSFYVPTDNATVEISIHTNCSDLPSSGDLAAPATSGTITAAGYHTFPIDTAIGLKKGEKFSVTVSVKTPGYNYPIPVETALEAYSEKANAAPGQSYISSDFGTNWNDLVSVSGYEKANVCIKAFTSDNTVPDPNITTQYKVLQDNGNELIASGTVAHVYGSAGANSVTLQPGAQARLMNLPGSNTITIQSAMSLFSVYRSGAMVTFEGSDGTVLTLPATPTAQTIVFNDDLSLELKISAGAVMVDSQTVGTEKTPL